MDLRELKILLVNKLFKKEKLFMILLKKTGFDGYKFIIYLSEYENEECKKLIRKFDFKDNLKYFFKNIKFINIKKAIIKKYNLFIWN